MHTDLFQRFVSQAFKSEASSDSYKSFFFNAENIN